MNSLNSWGIDDGARLEELIHDRYRVAAEICGDQMWLSQDVTRELPAASAC